MTVLSTPLLQRIFQFIKPRSQRLPGIACCIAVAGCSQFTGQSGFRYLPGINSAAYDSASSYRILHNYGYGTDGSGPAATLLDVNDTLYGTTPWGGANGAAELRGGSVFSLSSTGKERVLHSFGNGSDGNQPCAGLLDLNGVLYGTTRSGGADSRGTVFRIGTTGANYRVLHSFGTVKGDGIFPFAPLVAVSGMLYGTTSGGGAYSGGAVFSISASGANYRVLHSFGKGSDGVNSQAGLLAVKGAAPGR